MKHVIRIVLALVLAGLFVIALSWSAADITKSTNYKTYELQYLINLSEVNDDKKDAVANDLKTELNKRLNKFDVAEVSMELDTQNNDKFITVKFGTINKIEDIKNALILNETFIIKEKVAVVLEEENGEDAESDEETVTEDTSIDEATSEDEEILEEEPVYKTEIEERAGQALQQMLAGEAFEVVAQNEAVKDPLKVVFSQAQWMYEDEIKNVFAEILFDMEPGQVYQEVIKYQERPFLLAPPIDVFALAKLIDKKEAERSFSTPKLVDVSHILVAYKDAMRAAETTERTKEEARSLADEIKGRIDGGEDFSQLAKQYSDDTSNKDSGGLLRTPAGDGVYVEQFENAALKLEEAGQVSDVVESPFGFHIIKAGDIIAATEEFHQEPQFKFSVLFYAVQPKEWDNTELNRKHLTDVNIIYSKEYDPYLVLTFNNEGKDLLKAVTEKNMNNILGIFVGKELITSFTVQEINDKGTIKILRPSTTKEADELKKKLLQKPLPANIILMEEKSGE